MRRKAAGHDHSTQHLTDVRTRRVYASSGHGCAALGWDYPGSTLLEVRILRSDRGFASAAYDGAPEAGGGAAAAAGQTVVYHDVSGSFRDAGLQNGRRYYYTVFARHPGGEWVRWGEYELRPGVPATSVAGRLPAAFRRLIRGALPAAVVAALSGRPLRGARLRSAAAGEAEQTRDAEAVTAATADPAVPAVLRGHDLPDERRPLGRRSRRAGRRHRDLHVAGRERPAPRTASGRCSRPTHGGTPAPPYATVEHRVRITDLTALQVDVLLQDRPRAPDTAARRRDAVQAARRDLAAVLVVPVVHGSPVGAPARVPGGRRHRDRPRLAALARLEPQAAVDDPSRPPVHRPPGGHPLPPRRVRLAGVRSHLRGRARRRSTPEGSTPATWPRCRSSCSRRPSSSPPSPWS